MKGEEEEDGGREKKENEEEKEGKKREKESFEKEKEECKNERKREVQMRWKRSEIFLSFLLKEERKEEQLECDPEGREGRRGKEL